jgi:hypothetical protein
MELHLPDGQVLIIGNSAELAEALAVLPTVSPGEVVELKASAKHTIRAKRDDAYWVVTARRPGWWFRHTFTTGDWINPANRASRPFWAQRGSLTDEKVRTVFGEYFAGKKFSQPLEGA